MTDAHHDHHTHEDLVLDEAFWDERYGSKEDIWSGQVNPQLLAEAMDLASGTALDAGCGEGADALWLAGRGWQVTAVDISSIPLQRGAAHAAELGSEIAERITWQHADLGVTAPPEASYDLVAAHFLQLREDDRRRLYSALAAAVAPGGTLLIVGHHPTDMLTGVPRPPEPELFFTAEELAAELPRDGWEVVVADRRERTVQDPDGHEVTIADAVLRARRAG